MSGAELGGRGEPLRVGCRGRRRVERGRELARVDAGLAGAGDRLRGELARRPGSPGMRSETNVPSPCLETINPSSSSRR